MEIIIIILAAGLLFTSWFKLSSGFGDAFSLYFVVFGLVYIFRPAVLYFGLDTPIPDHIPNYGYNDKIVNAMILVIAWSIFFHIGSKFSLGYVGSVVFPFRDYRINTASYISILTLLFIINLALVLQLFLSYGFSISAVTRAIRIDGGISGFRSIEGLPYIYAYLAAALYFSIIKNDKKSSNLFPYMVIFSSFVAASAGLLFGGRGPFIYYIVFLTISYSFYVKKLGYISLTIAFTCVLSLLYLLKELRESMWSNGGSPGPVESSNLFRNISDSTNLDSYDKLTLIMQNEIPFLYGEGFLNSIKALIPRSLWSEKPQDLYMDIQFHNIFEPSTIGWPLKALGEWYWNFDTFGVMIGGFLSGLIFKSIQKSYSDYKEHPVSFMIMFMLSLSVFQGGYTAASILKYVATMVPIFIILFLSRVTRRKEIISI